MPRLVIALLAAGLAVGLGACGQSLSEVKVDDSKNGQSVKVHVGDTVKVTLNATYWTFDQSSDPLVLKELGDQVVTPDPVGSCLPGMGCGVTTAWYKALSAGSATVSASRVSCGEALRCVGNQGTYRVRVVVSA
jgi:hypothetical protein